MDEIEYEVREADLVAFNHYHAASSDTLKSAYRRNRYVSTLTLVLLAVLCWRAWDALPLALSFGLFGFIWFFFSPRYVRRERGKQVKRMYAEGRNEGTIGRQKLRVAPSGLTNSSEQGESQINWSAVERIAETPSHIFIYISAVTAFVIPRETTSGANLESLVHRMREFVDTAQQDVDTGV